MSIVEHHEDGGTVGMATARLTEELAPVLASETGALEVPHCRDRLKRRCLGGFPVFGN